jgi:hypothetical protein
MRKAWGLGLFLLFLPASVFFPWAIGTTQGNDTRARSVLAPAPWIQSAKLTAAGGVANDRFGRSVAVSGDTIVVGTSTPGRAYVFARPSAGWSGTRTQTATLTPSGGAPGDGFGSSVTINGDTIVVGAPDSTVGLNAGQGRAYVFVKPPAGWSGTRTQTATLTASGGAPGDHFGSSVAIDGQTIVVGAPDSTVGLNAGQGRAYVFVKPAAGWSGTRTQTATLTASGGAPGDHFGSSVAIGSDTALVGAPDSVVGLNAGQGRAYVFVRPVAGWSGTRSQTAELTAFGGAAGDHFGSSVAIGSDTALVGAPDSAVGLNAGQGRAYVFVRPVAGWSGTRSQTAILTGTGGAAGIGFGSSVAIRSDLALVGAPHSTVGLNAGQGSAFVFVRPILGWSGTRGQTSELTDFAGAAGDRFGFSVAISSDTVLVGADGRDADQGAAYVFTGGTGLNFFFLPRILRE